MNFRPYDILTQLIPGVLFVGYVVLILDTTELNLKLNTALYAFATVVCFIIGYIINGIGQVSEAIFAKKINDKVLLFYLNSTKWSWLKLFKPFTKLRHVDKTNSLKASSFSEIFEEIQPKQHERIKWLNQDKKFARSLIITSLILILSSMAYDFKATTTSYKPLSLCGTLLFVSLYRFYQSSIDYSFWVIKLYEKNRQNKDVY